MENDIIKDRAKKCAKINVKKKMVCLESTCKYFTVPEWKFKLKKSSSVLRNNTKKKESDIHIYTVYKLYA